MTAPPAESPPRTGALRRTIGYVGRAIAQSWARAGFVDSGGSRSRIRDDLARHSDLILTVTRTAASGRKRGVQAGEGEPPSGVDSAPSRSVSTLKPSAESRPSHIGGENGGAAAGLTHVKPHPGSAADPAASRSPGRCETAECAARPEGNGAPLWDDSRALHRSTGIFRTI